MEDIQKGISKPLQEMILSSGDEDNGYNSSSSYTSGYFNKHDNTPFHIPFGYHPRGNNNERGLDDFGDDDDSDDEDDEDDDLK